MEPTAIAHVTFGVASLALGAGIFPSRKGTDRHRVLGALYVLSMFGLNLTALLIYRLFGRFGVFHVLALISLATLLLGAGAVVLRRPRQGWLRSHYSFMGWSYVGLWAAALTEVTVRAVDWPLPVAVAVPTVAVTLVGGAWVQIRQREALARVGSGRAAA